MHIRGILKRAYMIMVEQELPKEIEKEYESLFM